jgi:hypothetical protein
VHGGVQLQPGADQRLAARISGRDQHARHDLRYLEVAQARVARFLLVQTYQNGKNLPKDHKVYQTVIN